MDHAHKVSLNKSAYLVASPIVTKTPWESLKQVSNGQFPLTYPSGSHLTNIPHTIGQQNDSHAHQTSPDQLSSTSSRSLIRARPYLANHIKAHLSHHNPIPATSSFLQTSQKESLTMASLYELIVHACVCAVLLDISFQTVFFFGKGSSNHNKSCSLQEKSSNGALYSSLGRGATQPVA